MWERRGWRESGTSHGERMLTMEIGICSCTTTRPGVPKGRVPELV
jgi:hypothetical protein